MTQNDTPPFQLQIVPVTGLQQNAMVFWSTATMNGVLVDPGGEIDKLTAAVKALGVTIVEIWLTHGHIDHVGAAAVAKRTYNVDIVGPHKDDQFLLDSLEAGTYGIAEAEPFTPDRYLSDGDTLELEGAVFQVLHCPGHSPGSVVFYQQAMALALVGDVLFKGSVGRTDLPRGNPQQLLTSIRTKLWPLLDAAQGEDIQFVPGHGPASTLAEERSSNPFVKD